MGEFEPNTSGMERAALLYRNLNIVGAIALFGIGVLVPPIAPAANVLAGIDVVQAVGGEAVRRSAHARRGKSPI